MEVSKEIVFKMLGEIQIQLEILRNQASQFLQMKNLDRKVIVEKYDSLRVQSDIVHGLILNIEKMQGINLFFESNKIVREDFNGLRIEYQMIQMQYNSKYTIDFYNLNDKELIENIDKNNKLFANEIDKLDDKFKEMSIKILEVDNIKSNLFSFFGLIIGLLAFIFVNYQFISSAKDLGIGKMLMFMGIANVGLICGILVILGILGNLLGKEEKFKFSFKILDSKIFLLGIVLIIGSGFLIDWKYDKPKQTDIEKNIKTNQELSKQQYEELKIELNKRDIEIGKLQNEIENLKNKK